MRILAILPVLVLGASTLAAPAVAQTLQLDEAKVVELALSEHPIVQAAESSRDAASAGRDAAQLARVPDLRLSGRYSRLSSVPERFRSFDGFVFPQLLDNFGARAQLSIPLSDAFLGLAAAARAAGREAEAAQLEVVTARAQIAYEARVAFLDYWRQSLAVVNAAELVHAAESNAVDQRARETAGTVAHNDVLAFETQLDAAVMDQNAAEGELAAAEATLRTFFPQLARTKLLVPALPPAETEAREPSAPERPAAAPRIASLEARVRAADAREQSASWSRLPRLGLVAAGDLSAPSPRVFVMTKLVAVPTWELGVQLEWSLSQATEGSARAAQARHEHAAMAARLVDAKRRLDGERDGARGLLRAAHERLQRARERVTHAETLAKARRGELEAGTALPLNVVLAEADVVRAKNEHVEAFVARAAARAKLDFVDGRTGAAGASR